MNATRQALSRKFLRVQHVSGASNALLCKAMPLAGCGKVC